MPATVPSTSFRLIPSLLPLLLALLVAVPAVAAPSLDLIGRYDSGLGEGATEVAVYDAGSQRLYVVNAVTASFDILDLSDPTDPGLIKQIDVTMWGAEANSVAVHDGLVAVAVEADDTQAPGKVVFFDLNGTFVAEATVGALPDMVTFTPGGDYVLVANEGEPNDDYTVDPEGSVSTIDVSDLAGAGPVVTTLGFSDFNAGGTRAAELPSGVRIFGPGASVAQDLEPEYIAVSSDGSTAWVAMQENNALAILDLTTMTVSSIVDLGTKDHSLAGNEFDASNRDDGINIQNWNTHGMYQPDAIAAYTVNGQTFVVSANEGDARDYDGFSEEERVDDLTLDPTTYPDAATLQLDENLGRLKTTNTEGDLDGDGDVDQIYSYGARSFSIWSSSGELVYDSGADFENITAAAVPGIFNSDQSDPDEFDDRSDDKGPEPEGVVVGQVGDRTLAFVGLERVGGIMVYDVTDPIAPEFVLYREPVAGDQAPEGLAFIAAGDNPTRRPLLAVAHEDSGTVSIFQLNDAAGVGPCAEDAETHCLQNGRHSVSVAFETTEGQTGSGKTIDLTDDSGLFWFFGPDNAELLVKVLDSCEPGGNGNFWLFVGGTTNVGVELTVTDHVNGTQKTYDTAAGPLITALADVDYSTCD